MSDYKEKIKEARRLYKLKKYDEAIKAYYSAFLEYIDLYDLLELGGIYLELSNFAQAKEVFDFALSLDSTFAPAYYALALIDEEFNNTKDAIENYQLAIKYDPQYDAAYFNIAGIYDEEGDVQKALEYYKKTLLVNYNNFWAHVNIGSLYEQQGYNELALQHTLKAYSINSNMKKVCFNLGVIYTKLNKIDLALKYYLEELTKEDHYQMTYLNLGLLYKDYYQDLFKAKLYYLQGISRDKDDYNLWYNLGCVYSILGEYEDAYSCLLYAYLLNTNLQADILNDPELEQFRTTEYFEKIKEVFIG